MRFTKYRQILKTAVLLTKWPHTNKHLIWKISLPTSDHITKCLTSSWHMDIWQDIWIVITPWIVISILLLISYNLADKLERARWLNDVRIRRCVSHIFTIIILINKRHLPDNSWPCHFQLKVKNHQYLPEGLVGTGQSVLVKWFVPLTVVVVLRFLYTYLGQESQQRLQQDPK